MTFTETYSLGQDKSSENDLFVKALKIYKILLEDLDVIINIRRTVKNQVICSYAISKENQTEIESIRRKIIKSIQSEYPEAIKTYEGSFS